MKKNIKNIILPALLFSMLAFIGCDKTKPYPITVPPAVVHFTSGGAVAIKSDSDDPSVKIGIGTSDVENVDREVEVTITSPTGAVAGQEYTLSTSKVTIPAGKATADIVITANPSGYAPGDRDTLLLTLVEVGGLTPATFNTTKTVVITGPCDDADVDLSTMSGTYKNTKDADGSYTVTVSGLTETSPTTGKGMIANLWGDVDPVEINFDWTDPDNIFVSIPMQYMGYDYAEGQPMTIRTSPGKVSTFSVCNQSFTLYVDFIVNNYPTAGSAVYYEKEFKITVNR